jgi:hypothetical protein
MLVTFLLYENNFTLYIQWNDIQQTVKTSYGIRPPRRCFNDEINSLRNIVCKWVGDCCLTPSVNILSYVMARTNHTLMRWWWYQLFLTNSLNCLLYIIPFRVISPDVILIFPAIAFSNVVFPDPAENNKFHFTIFISCFMLVTFLFIYVFIIAW